MRPLPALRRLGVDLDPWQAAHERTDRDLGDQAREGTTKTAVASKAEGKVLIRRAAELAWALSLPNQPLHSTRVLVRLVHAGEPHGPQLMLTVNQATVDAAENVLQLIPALQQATGLPVQATEKITYIPPLERR